MNRRQLLATGLAATVAGATGLPALASDDSILIERIIRAPERRVFYIDVGNIPPERAREHIATMKARVQTASVSDYFLPRVS